MAIFAAPYAVFQADSLDDPGSLGAMLLGSQDAETIDNAIALVEAASALLSPTLGWNVPSSLLMYSAGGVGVEGWLFVGVDEVEVFFRKRRIMDAGIQRVYQFPFLLRCHVNVTAEKT